MKIIDLLNKIANGEKIKKFIFDDRLFELDDGVYRQKNGSSLSDYCFIEECLNDEIYEVEVIEDNKKIEHIGKKYDITDFKRKYPKVAELVKDLNNKQYEIINKLNEVLNDKD